MQMGAYDGFAEDEDYAARLNFRGQGAVVLGAGQGIGREVSRALASAGARVLCVDSDEGRARAVAAEIDGLPYVADIMTSGGIADVLAHAIARHSELGDIRTVVDIVGAADNNRPIVDADEEWWRDRFAVNLDHNFTVTRIFGKHLSEQGAGSIVHIASIAANNANPQASGYAAAKAALVSLTQTAAAELGPYGVRVNCVSPGVTMTPRHLARVARNEKVYPVRELTGRHCTPGDIASGVLFLASDLARQITGQQLVIDGGVTVLNQVLYAGQA